MFRIAQAVALVLCAASAGAQVRPPSNPLAPRDPTGAELKGTSIIRGRVTSLDGGKPLRRARISVTSPELSSARTASTSTDGRYEIRDLPAGRYTIRVNRSGYLPLSYGQRRPGEAGKPLELADKQTVERVDFALPRMGVISGRVVDEVGEPIAGVQVWAMQLQFFQGARRLVPMGGGIHGTTDDTGQYRLLALPPGDYIVMAVSRETWPLDNDPKQVFSYAPTYYPNTASPADSQRVKVGVGQELGAIDIGLIPGRTAKISGTVLSAAGVPLGGESISLGWEVRGPSMSSMSMAGNTKSGADGAFTLSNVSPGEYQLSVRVPARNDQPAQEAQQTINVTGADIEGLVVIAGSGGSIRGTVVTDDGSPLPADLERLIVRAQSVTPGARTSFPAPDNGRVGKDGAFELKGLFGPVVLSVGSLTGDWTLKAVEMEGRDLADDPIDVPHGDVVSGVRVVLTNRPTWVRGGLTDEKLQPAEGTVIIFAEEPARWREGGRAVRAARPDQKGEFSFKGLPPGNYLIAGVDYVQEGQWNDPEFLEGLKPRADRVSLADAESKRVDVRLLK